MQQMTIKNASNHSSKNFGEEGVESISDQSSVRWATASACNVHRSICIPETSWLDPQGLYQGLVRWQAPVYLMWRQAWRVTATYSSWAKDRMRGK